MNLRIFALCLAILSCSFECAQAAEWVPMQWIWKRLPDGDLERWSMLFSAKNRWFATDILL